MQKKKIFWFFITLLLVFFITPFVYADTGPKPHAEYTFKNLEESNYIVAVIYKKKYMDLILIIKIVMIREFMIY